jgi:hypothetical protein
VDELVAAIKEQLAHAEANGHILDRDCQGVGPGERVPAVRISNIQAVLERFVRRG